ncbi:MAG TPA: hypothetical protein VFK10_21325, partial [Burkholderiaceae bacterium]|nr:hypothetical protein [Burkholderiaceae bacterium]
WQGWLRQHRLPLRFSLLEDANKFLMDRPKVASAALTLVSPATQAVRPLLGLEEFFLGLSRGEIHIGLFYEVSATLQLKCRSEVAMR